MAQKCVYARYECVTCGREILSKTATEFCTRKCRYEHYRRLQIGPFAVKMQVECVVCGTVFGAARPHAKMCSDHCRRLRMRQHAAACRAASLAKTAEKVKAKVEAGIADPADLNQSSLEPFQLAEIDGVWCGFDSNQGIEGLWFPTEAGFTDWFAVNYPLFGIRRILKLDRFFPDCKAELHGGRVLDIELEYFAYNFAIHKHDPAGCDLIISFMRSPMHDKIKGVPVLSLFDVERFAVRTGFDRTRLSPSPFLRGLMAHSAVCTAMTADSRVSEQPIRRA